MQERRQSPRVPCHLPVQVVPRRTSKIIQTLTKDLSLRGLRCISPTAMPAATPCLIELLLGAGQEPLYLEGSVIWCEPIAESELFYLGLVFDSASPFHTSQMSAYLERISSQPAASSS